MKESHPNVQGRQLDRRKLVEAALALQDLGLNPIPLVAMDTSQGKKPFVYQGELKNGFFLRRSTESDVRTWVERSKDSAGTGNPWRWENLGLVTNRTSGLFVVDEDHEEAWGYLNMLGVRKDTRTWKWSTGRGLQMAFKLPEGLRIPTLQGRGRLLRDVPFDIKGEGGYVAVPPSVHHSGPEYRYVDGFSPWECPLAEAPPRLLGAICRVGKDVRADINSRDFAAECPLPSEVVDRLRTKNARLDALNSADSSIGTENLSIPLEEDLREQLRVVKMLFFKHDIPLTPILETSRKLTLISHFRRITRNEEMNPEELQSYIRMANNTLCFDKEGTRHHGLEEEELEEVFDLVTRNLPEKSSPEVQKKLTALKTLIGLLLPKLKRPRDTDAKVIQALAEHGIKYGRSEGEKIRIDASKDIIRRLSRIKSENTLDRSLKRMEGRGIEKGRDTGARTNHYLLDLSALARERFWGVSDISNPKGGGGDVLKGDTSPPPPLGIEPDRSMGGQEPRSNLDRRQHDVNSAEDYEEIVQALLHTTHHGGVGQASVRQIMAFLKLGGTRRGPVHTQDLADELDVTRGSIYKTLKELRGRGVVEFLQVGRGYYGLTDEFLDNFHLMRKEKGEFEKDETIREGVEENRKVIGYEKALFRAVGEGRGIETVPAPTGVPMRRVLKAQARTMARTTSFGDRMEATVKENRSLDESATYQRDLYNKQRGLAEEVELLRIEEGDEAAATFAKDRGYYHPELNPDSSLEVA